MLCVDKNRKSYGTVNFFRKEFSLILISHATRYGILPAHLIKYQYQLAYHEESILQNSECSLAKLCVVSVLRRIISAAWILKRCPISDGKQHIMQVLQQPGHSGWSYDYHRCEYSIWLANLVTS